MRVILAQPRGFCAGVVRAINVLDRVLERGEGPVYAFHEIVHNRYVVDDFRRRGAIFVEDVAEVPPGARIVFSAHGIAPAVVEAARAFEPELLFDLHESWVFYQERGASNGTAFIGQTFSIGGGAAGRSARRGLNAATSMPLGMLRVFFSSAPSAIWRRRLAS